MKNLLKNKAGMTLVEVLIAIAVGSILLTVIFQIMDVSNRSNTSTEDIISSTNALDRTTDSIRQVVMAAESMTITGAGSYTLGDDEEVIYCDGSSLYYNSAILTTAKECGVARIEAVFEAEGAPGANDNMLDVTINCYDEDGTRVEGKCRSIEVYLNSIGGDGSGSIDTAEGADKSAVVFKSIHN